MKIDIEVLRKWIIDMRTVTDAADDHYLGISCCLIKFQRFLDDLEEGQEIYNEQHKFTLPHPGIGFRWAINENGECIKISIENDLADPLVKMIKFLERKSSELENELYFLEGAKFAAPDNDVYKRAHYNIRAIKNDMHDFLDGDDN